MKLIQIYNYPSHYRAPIYSLIDKEIGGDFCFADRVFGQNNLKKFETSILSGKVWELQNVKLPIGYFFKGCVKFARANYDTYLVVGETRNISVWLLMLILLFYPKKRVFLWSHGMLGDEGWLSRRIINLFYKLSDGAFIYNKRSCKIMADNGIPISKLHTIYNSLNYDEQLEIRKNIKSSTIYQDYFGNSNKVIVFIGRLTKAKRFDLLIDAVVLLKDRGIFVNVTFIGDGDDRKNMEIRIENAGIKNQIWFYGACYDETQNAEMLYNADLCVSPGFIGLTAIHALMFGCPAITHNDFSHQAPEFEAIQKGKTGDFFDRDDSSSLACCVSNWLSNHEDDREKVRQACFCEIDTNWNPHNQIRIIKKVLLG